MFSSLVSSQRIPAALTPLAEREVLVALDPALTGLRSVSLLRVEGEATVLSLSPARAEQLELSASDRIERGELSARLDRAGMVLADPDHLFYLPLTEQAVLREEPWEGATRQLTEADAAVFAEFTAQAPEGDLDEAFVELDHWLVVGTFCGERLVSAASMYPWGETLLADLGVITLPEFRGRGLGRATVRAISAAALARGYEPQYRCQLENTASAALARAAGFALFGVWEGLESAG
ncbi:GNAT family N-acetyltransferase [uncultured Brachybacterium sp.]|uniref:GNAT family N-acetyltransferase n=1 Tax=uncultured Brachybacterium sp. TaxID=189680 RepID=UPI0026076093|nr:GNAT family N-acetyltransferase [uncultured Brachybacterium sp.]